MDEYTTCSGGTIFKCAVLERRRTLRLDLSCSETTRRENVVYTSMVLSQYRIKKKARAYREVEKICLFWGSLSTLYVHDQVLVWSYSSFFFLRNHTPLLSWPVTFRITESSSPLWATLHSCLLFSWAGILSIPLTRTTSQTAGNHCMNKVWRPIRPQGWGCMGHTHTMSPACLVTRLHSCRLWARLCGIP